MTRDRFDQKIATALREEAYSVPLRLDPVELRSRLPAPRSSALPTAIWRVAAVLVLGAVMAALIVAAPRLPAILGPAATPACPVSQLLRYGDSWWREVGGPNAFFAVLRLDQFHSSSSGWLIHVRFDPPPDEAQRVTMWAQQLGDERRVEALLGEPVDAGAIYHFDQPAPRLPGSLYLFQQPLPGVGCWQLFAAVDGDVAGNAVIDVGAGPPDAVPGSGAPTPGRPQD